MPARFRINLPDNHVEFAYDNDDGLDHVASVIERDGLAFYELPLPTILASLAREIEGAFIDVGGNTGVYALLAAASSPNLTVHTFEPVPSIVARMRSNIALNGGLERRIHVHDVALSDKPGTAVISEHVNAVGLVATSSTLELNSKSPQEKYRDFTVETQTFDLWTKEKQVLPGLIKVDIEGHEPAFLRGAIETIKKFRPFIIIELLFNSDFALVDDLIHDLGYSDIALLPQTATRLDHPFFISEAWNHLLCPNEKLWDVARICTQIGLPVS